MGAKKQNFFYWYYNGGIHGLLEIWKNFLVFVWLHFSIAELFGTLFSPWHHDIGARSWRGLHPLRTLELFFENIISRVLGGVVRSLVIAVGLLLFLCVLAIGISINLLWIIAPIGIVFLSIMSVSGLFQPIETGGIFLLWIIFSGVFYRIDTEIPVADLDSEELLKHPVFERICGRLGMICRRFPKEILGNQKLMDDFLKMHGLTQGDYARIIGWEFERYRRENDSQKFWRLENLKKIPPVGFQWRYGYTVNLDKYANDLSEYDASEYSKAELFGRADEYEVLKLLLERPDQNCALLVGDPGIGKKTLIHYLARKIRSAEEQSFNGARVLLLDLGRAISDAVNNGEDVENFLRRIFYEASYAGNVILVIEHLEQFLGNDQSVFHPDISAVLAEFFSLPSFRVVATSSLKEYHRLIEKQQQINKYFEVIEIREPSEEETIDILLFQLDKYEKKRILFTFKAIKTIVSGSGKYNWEIPLPERALDLAMDVLMFWDKKSDEQFVSEGAVTDYLTLKTGVAQGEIGGDERKKLMNLESELHRQVIGQEEAVRQVSEALRRARSGIGDSQKPIGSFLFLGPTGVGKTETAKALAKVYFGDESKMIRLDMSEFQNPNSLDRLLGSNHLNRPGRLVTQIKDNPCSLLLLDEIEKAYPDVLDIFLQILDEGFVTDAFGEKINFRNTIIIATSNVGASFIKKMIENGGAEEDMKKEVIDYAIEHDIFRTEFLNRFEGIIFFQPLKANELKSVVRLQLQKFIRRVAKEKNIEISFDDSTVEHIIQGGYNPIFGARSLNRYIEDVVDGIVAKKIISGEVANGGRINISV